MIDVTCPNPECRRVYHAEASHVGKTIRCTNPKCNSLVPIVDGTSAKIMPGPPGIPVDIPRRPVTRPRAGLRFSSGGARYLVLVTGLIIFVGALIIYIRYSTHSSSTSSAPPVKEQSEHKDIFDEVAADKTSRREADAPLTVVGEEDIPQTVRRSRKTPIISEGAPKQLTSLPNGARIAPDVGLNGHGELVINNGTHDDAEVILYNPERDEQTCDLVVKNHNVFRLSSIPEGSYELKFCFGESCFMFERPLDYNEQTTEEGQDLDVKYSEIRVTLHPVIGGNARTKPMSRAEFLRGHPKRL